MVFLLLLLRAKSNWFAGFVISTWAGLWWVFDFRAKPELLFIHAVRVSLMNSFIVGAIKETDEDL